MTSRTRRCDAARWVGVVGLICWLAVVTLPVLAAESPATHHTVWVESGDVIRFEAVQRGTDIILRLFDPQGVELMEADRWTRDVGPELILWLTEVTGVYALEVSAPTPSGWESPSLSVQPFPTLNERLTARTYADFIAAAAAHAPVSDLQRIAERLARLGEDTLRLEVQYEIALRHRSVAGWEDGTKAFAALVQEAQGLDESFWQVVGRDSWTQALMDGGHAEQALVEAERGLAQCRRLEEDGWPMRYWQGLAHMRRQRAYSYLGQLELSFAEADKALGFLRAPEDNIWLANVLHQRGVIYRRNLGDPERAMADLRRSLELQPRHVSRSGPRANTFDQLGAAHEMLGEFEAARTAYEQAIDIRGDRHPCAGANHRSSLALLLTKEAVRRRDRLWELSRRDGRQLGGERLAEIVDLDGAAEQQRRAAIARLAQQEAAEEDCGRDGQAVRLRLAEAARHRGEHEEARTFHRQRLSFARQQGDRLAILESYIALSYTASDRGAEELLQAAMSLYESMRLETQSYDLRLGLANAARQLFDLRVARLAAQPLSKDSLQGAHAGALAVAEQGRARLLLDSLGHTSSEAGPLDVQELAQRLGDSMHLLEIRLGEQGSHLWWLSEGELIYRPLAPRSTIEQLVRPVRHALTEPTSSYVPQVQRLSSLLLGPIQHQLAALAKRDDGARLVVVADGILETLPLAALSFEFPAYRPLVERFEVTHLPAASLLLQPVPSRQRGNGWVVIADPLYDTLSSLSASAVEADNLQRLADAQQQTLDVWRGVLANKQRVLAGDLERAALVHFAVHGVAHGSQPGEAALMLSQVDVDGRTIDGRLRARELAELSLSADLIVLSACDTGLGALEPGEGLISGLARGFLQAGARQVVASLWKISDAVTAELMTRLYTELLYQEASASPATALRHAQLDLRRRDKTSHPFYWAGFVIQGAD